MVRCGTYSNGRATAYSGMSFEIAAFRRDSIPPSSGRSQSTAGGPANVARSRKTTSKGSNCCRIAASPARWYRHLSTGTNCG